MRLLSDGRDDGVCVLAGGLREKLLQLPLERLKRRPLHLILVPTVEHDLIERDGTAGGARHTIAVLHLVENFSIGHA